MSLDRVNANQLRGHLKAWTYWARSQGLGHNGGPSRSHLSLNKTTNSNNFNGQVLFPVVFFEKEFWTICQPATCDDRRPCLGLPPYTIITHSVKRL
ncbi:hypothetical protein TNCV_4367681 [Trichonephila clavipes]|nr:hypothetical protein TNCV_4367681 [Trichonephila clavipes]